MTVKHLKIHFDQCTVVVAVLIHLVFCAFSCLVCGSRFSPDIFSSMSILPSLKVCLDLSAEYLILSDVQRKVGISFYCWLCG